MIPYPKSLLLAALAFAALLVILVISVFIGARIYVPIKVDEYGSRFSSKAGVSARVSNLKYDVFHGLYGEGISIAHAKEPSSPFLTIGSVTLGYDLIQSLLSSRIGVKATFVASVVDLSSWQLHDVVHLAERLAIGGTENTLSSKEGPHLRVELESISIVDAEVRLKEGYRVYVRDAVIWFTKGERGMEVSIRATASLGGSDFFVKVKVAQGDQGTYARVQAFFPLFIPMAHCPRFIAGCEARVFLSAVFDIGEEVRGKGYLSFSSAHNLASEHTLSSGRVDFNFTYNRYYDMASIDELRLYLEGVGSLSLHGGADGLKTHERCFVLNGQSGDIEAHSFFKWFADLPDFDVSGLLRVEQVTIRGDGRTGEITWEAGITGRGIEAEHHGVIVSGGAWEMNTRGVLRENALSDASGEGRFYVESVSSHYGIAKVASGRFDFIFKQGGDVALNVRNLRFFALGGSAAAGIKYEVNSGRVRSHIELAGKGFDFSALDLKPLGVKERIDGLVENLSVSLTGSTNSGWEGKASFSLSGLSIKGKGFVLDAKSVSSKSPVYLSLHNRMELTSSGIGFSGLEGVGIISIKEGYAQGRLTYVRQMGLSFDAKVKGSGLSIFDAVDRASGFEASLKRDEVSGAPISGRLIIDDGKLFGRGFSVASASFSYTLGELGLRDIAIEKRGFGTAKSKSVEIAFKKGRATGLKLEGASLYGMGGRLRLDDGNAYLRLDSRGRWHGEVKVASGMVPHAWFEEMVFSLEGGRDYITLSSISAKINEGVLEGSLALRTGEVRGSVRYSGGGVAVGEGFVSLGDVNLSMDLKYPGTLVPFPSGRLELSAYGITPEGYGEGLSYDGVVEFTGDGKTLSLSGKVKDRASGEEAGLWARALRAGNEVLIEGSVPKVSLGNFYGIIAPLLFPIRVELTSLVGRAAMDLKARVRWGERTAEVYSSEGSIELMGLSLGGRLRGMEVAVENMNGTIPLSNGAQRSWLVSSVPQGYFEGDRESFGVFMARALREGFYESTPSISAKRLRIGVMDLASLEGRLEISPERIVLNKIHSNLYGGELLAEGSYPIGAGGMFDFAFLINELSLKQFTEALGMQGYITGRVSGVGVVRGNAGLIESSYGSFSLWSVKAKGEPRLIGQAFLEKLGVGRLFIRSPRKYDRGEVYGRISRGIITFKEFNISHTSFGVKDLSIRVDPVRNSIAITHLFSVMRETARQIKRGGIEFEIEK